MIRAMEIASNAGSTDTNPVDGSVLLIMGMGESQTQDSRRIAVFNPISGYKQILLYLPLASAERGKVKVDPS